MPRARKYPEELIERGIRLVFESGRPIARVARDLGVSAVALRERVRRAEVFELRRANSILKEASVYFARELDPNRPS